MARTAGLIAAGAVAGAVGVLVGEYVAIIVTIRRRLWT